MKDAHNISLDNLEIERITEQLVSEKKLGFGFVYPPDDLYLHVSMKVYWLKGFAPSELRAAYWDSTSDKRKTLEVPLAVIT